MADEPTISCIAFVVRDLEVTTEELRVTVVMACMRDSKSLRMGFESSVARQIKHERITNSILDIRR